MEPAASRRSSGGRLVACAAPPHEIEGIAALQNAAGSSTATNSSTQGPVVDLIVRRIAQSLGVPVSALTEDAGLGPQSLNAPAVAELRTLLTTFLLLDHPAARRRCIALAEAELARQNRTNGVGATV